MPELSINVFRKGEIPPLNKHALDLTELWVMEDKTSSGKATVALHFKDQKNKDYVCETTARLADGMSGAIVTANLMFTKKPLGMGDAIDYFGFFNTMKNKMKLLYFKAPGATEAGWEEYSKEIVINKMINL